MGAKNCEGEQRCKEGWTTKEEEKTIREAETEKLQRENEKMSKEEWSWGETTNKFLQEKDILG